MPKRIQRKRTKGWRMPANTVYVGRPTRWGNPFKVLDGDHAQSVRLFRELLVESGYEVKLTFREETISIETVQLYLRGRNLACWCPLEIPCHVDVLLEIANK